jgi:hypothetical protein
MRSAAAIAREKQRDDLFANSDTPAPTGPENSSVSEASLTSLAHARAAAVAGPAVAPALDPSLRAGLLPPGQPRAAGDTGARTTTGGPAQNQRGTGRNGPAR